MKITNLCDPLVPSAHKSVRIAKISILKLEGIIKKISYERRDYESVDENCHILGYVSKNYEKKNLVHKGLNDFSFVKKKYNHISG